MGRQLRPRRVESLARSKRLLFGEKQIAVFQGHHIEKSSVRIVRRRKPIGGSVDAGADRRSLSARHSAGKYWPAGCIYTGSPVEFVDERFCAQKLSGSAIENVEKPVAVGLHQEVSRYPALVDVNQHRSFIRVEGVQVVRRELEIPFQFAGVGIQSQDASGIKVVSRARFSCKIRSRIAGRPVQGVEL